MTDAAPILHILTPLRHVSPFDIGMAVDAGFKVIVPYTSVELEDVPGLVQDAMFSRAPADAARTGILVGGRDLALALDMMEAARAALVAPFELSLLADPAGACTAAAAAIALLEHTLQSRFDRHLPAARLLVIGAGPVGVATAILAAVEGASVGILARRATERASAAVASARRRFGIALELVDGADANGTSAALARAEALVSAATAGRRVLATSQLAAAGRLLLAIDLNTVPPAGLEGVVPGADRTPLAGGPALAIGPDTAGALKNAVETTFLRRIVEGQRAVRLDLASALEEARRLVAAPPAAGAHS